MKGQLNLRKVEFSDIDNLILFFKKAYGEQTIFQNEIFLNYYFGINREYCSSSNLIGENSNGEIVSHYGVLDYKLKLNSKIVPIFWGVNAFTLIEWRGLGINSKIVDYIHDNYEVNSVIGMPFEAPFFYQKLGYNIFSKQTLSRFIYIIDYVKSYNVVKQIQQDISLIKPFNLSNQDKNKIEGNFNVVELTKANFQNYSFDLYSDEIIKATTLRDKDFLDKRIFSNPFINYNVYGISSDGTTVTSYIAVRQEVLKPTEDNVYRIIDVFGHKDEISFILDVLIYKAFENNIIYIDFSFFGNYYNNEFIENGFQLLVNDETTILPMVTSPIEKRPNHEFIVLQSKIHNEIISKLTIEDVFFTRIDGDRDRINRISQL